MEHVTRAQVHRFRDCVAVYVGDGRTCYLTPAFANKLAAALRGCAHNIENEPEFAHSQFQTVELIGENG